MKNVNIFLYFMVTHFMKRKFPVVSAVCKSVEALTKGRKRNARQKDLAKRKFIFYGEENGFTYRVWVETLSHDHKYCVT